VIAKAGLPGSRTSLYDGRQEPGEAAEIRGFCERSYGVSFPMFAKIAVNGPKAHPLYRHLKAARPGALGTEAINRKGGGRHGDHR
jgi:glutathione peroxidase-family protein